MCKHIYFDDGISVSSNRHASRKQLLDCNISTRDFYNDYHNQHLAKPKDDRYWELIELLYNAHHSFNWSHEDTYWQLLSAYNISVNEIRDDYARHMYHVDRFLDLDDWL